MKFKKVERKSLISEFSKLVFKYIVILQYLLNHLTKIVEPILESKFKQADVEIMKIENSKEIRGLGPSFPKLP